MFAGNDLKERTIDLNTESKLFLPLSPDELERVMRAVFPDERVQASRLLDGGLFNTTYRVETTAHDVVLRMGPMHPELLLPFEENLMAAEAYVDDLCRANGVPASSVLCCDTSHSVIDRDFMVVERIDSIPMSDPMIPEAALQALSVSCGALVRRLHEIEGEKFGRISEILRGRGQDTWGSAVLMEYQNLIAASQKYGVFEDELLKWALAFAEGAVSLLDRVKTPRLAHADLWYGNILVKAQSDHTYAVRAIIDGDRAVFGDVSFDLDSPWMINDAFLEGYGEISSAFSPEEDRRKKQVYSLLFALTDAYVWRVEYCSENNYQSCLAQVKSILQDR